MDCMRSLDPLAIRWTQKCRQAVLDGHEIDEIRIAYALPVALDEDSRHTDLRRLVEVTGLSYERVRALVPVAGQTSPSGLLFCVQRGEASFEGHTPMVVAMADWSGSGEPEVDWTVREDAQGRPYPPRPKAPREFLQVMSQLDLSHVPGVTTSTTHGHEDVQEPLEGQLTHNLHDPLTWADLDPADDRWRNRAGEMGSEGWALALVHGRAVVDVRPREVAAVLGVGLRAAYDAVGRLVERSWGAVTRAGRGLVRLDFSRLDDVPVSHERQDGRRTRHRDHRVTFRRRATELGRMAWRMVRNRASSEVTLDMVESASGDRSWRPALAAGEGALFERLEEWARDVDEAS